MTPLRQRMIRAMELHRLTQATKDAYLQAIVQLAKFHSRSPDQLSADEVRFVRILESEGTCQDHSRPRDPQFAA